MSTPELDQWLRKHDGLNAATTVAGVGPGNWDSNVLARSQERPKDALFTTKTVYRLYTEDVHLPRDRNDIIKRYFDGATVYWGVGLDARTQDGAEAALIVEIVTSAPDALQRIVDLAGDLRVAGKQISVLVTRQTVDTFEVTA